MMKIEFCTSGTAFYDEYADSATNCLLQQEETIRILKRIINDLDFGHTYGPIMDINGNKIGEWSLN